jgi:3-isopropylmalate dehydratase large subunit
MKTLFDKVWDAHVVTEVKDGPTQLYIDRHLCHEVTSPQAFAGLRARGLSVFRPEQTTLTADHNIPTMGQENPIRDAISRFQVETLAKNAREFGLTYYGLGNPKNGIVHVIGPENGYTQPGMTIVCGDSHTSTHGAFGAIAFGIGTSEVEMVLASQCILQTRPKTMRINFEGKLSENVGAKDMALYMISQLTTGGATGYFVEYAGEAVRNLTMEQRMTLCNLSIEMGARGGLIAPDETTFNYIKGRQFAPQGERWEEALAYWKTLKSDEGAVFDKEVTFDAGKITDGKIYTFPMKGTIDASVPDAETLIINDEKETTEHNTIVDLLRNDISRVAHRVQVNRFRYIDEIKTNRSKILQVSSEIEGTLSTKYISEIGDIIFNLLPAGSVSGAPKESTLRLIRESESSCRGFYTGVAGYFDGANLDSFVLIRFIEQNEEGLVFRSGGGITAGSELNKEYSEAVQKVYLPF